MRSIWCSVFRCLLLVACVVQAQAQMDTAAYTIDLDDFVITAQYAPTHYKSALHRVNLIKREDFQSRGAVNLNDAIEVNPAIRIQYDPILGSTVRMRGISSRNVAILRDGVPVIGRLDGALDLSQISLQQVERIEIVEGALSNLYGSNAAGGVINIISKKSQAQKWALDLESQWETIGQQNYQASVGYAWKKCILEINGRYNKYQQFPIDSMRLADKIELPDGSSFFQSVHPFNPKQQWGLGGFLRYDFNPASFMLARVRYNNEDVQDYGLVKRIQFNPYADDQFFNTQRTDVSLQYKRTWSKYHFDWISAYNVYDRKVEDKRYYLESQTFDSLDYAQDKSQFTSLFNKLVFSAKPNDAWSFLAGLQYNLESGKGDNIKDLNRKDSTRAQFTEVAPYLDVRFSKIKNLEVSLSGRYTYHSAYKGKFTPSLQLKYNLGEAWVFRGSYAQGYRSPSLKELYLSFVDINHNILGNPDLRPETSHDLQFNIDVQANKHLSFGLNLYRTQIKDRIDLLQYGTLKFTYDNIDDYRVYGMQPSLSYEQKGFEFNSSATLGYWATAIEASEVPDYTPVFDMNNQLVYRWEKTGLKFNLNHRLFGKQPNYRIFDGETNVQTIDPYQLLDFSMSRQFLKERLQAVVGVNNIFNVQSTNISAQDGNGINHGVLGTNAINPGRAFFIQLAYRIK